MFQSNKNFFPKKIIYEHNPKDNFDLPILHRCCLKTDAFDGLIIIMKKNKRAEFSQLFSCMLCRFQYLAQIITDFCIIHEKYRILKQEND